VLLAAIVALAVAAAPVYASGALPCPCHATATGCPCHAGACDLQTPPASACHCAPACALLPALAADLSVAGEGQWVASPAHRLWGLKTVPPLRPPILV